MVRYTDLTKQFGKYFIVALIGLFFDFATLVFLREVAGLHYLVAATGGFLCGLFVNFVLSNRYVFSDPKIKSKNTQFLLFAIIGLIGLGILTLTMWLLTNGLGINYLLSKVFATCIVYLWNFFARRSLYHN